MLLSGPASRLFPPTMIRPPSDVPVARTTAFAGEERAERALYAADTAVFDAQRRDLALHEREVCRPLDGALHIRLIRAPVGL